MYVGTQGTVFVRSLTAFNKRKSANLQIFYIFADFKMLVASNLYRNTDYFAVKRSVLFFYTPFSYDVKINKYLPQKNKRIYLDITKKILKKGKQAKEVEILN